MELRSPITRRTMLQSLAALGLSSQVRSQDTYSDPATRIKPRTTGQWARLTPLYESDDFVVAEFKNPLEAKLKERKLSDDSYVRTVIDAANHAVRKAADKFPEKPNGSKSSTNIKTQFHIVKKLMQAAVNQLSKRFPDKDLKAILTPRNILPNFFLLNNINARQPYFNDYESMETIAERFSIKANEVNLFHADISSPIHAELIHPRYNKVKAFLAELFPGQKVPCEIVYKTVNDPSYWALGTCQDDRVYLCSARIKETALRNDNSLYLEKYTTLVNELLHFMMNEKFLSQGIEKVRGGLQLAGKYYGSDFAVEYNQQVEEALSDVTSLAFNPNSLIDMLLSPYPLSSALASRVVKDILPKRFDHLKYHDWRVYEPSVIKEDFIDELKKQGIKEPDLERDLYLPAYEKLKAFALLAMKDFDDLLKAEKLSGQN